MPSCDGSNCSACSACNCKVETKKEYIHLDKEEKRKYEKRIKDLEKELMIQKGVNKELMSAIIAHKKGNDDWERE